MTIPLPRRRALRPLACFGLAGLVLLGAVQGAAAEGDGIGGFLSSIFGGAPQAAPQAAPVVVPGPAPVYLPRRHPRPLTVRLHRVKPKLVVAEVPTKPGKVSIFEDRTLRRGDAVMMAGGVRVFAGSASFPYAAGDFVALKSADGLDRDASRALAQLDRAPRG